MTVKYYANKGIHPVYKISKMTAGMECLKLLFISGVLMKVIVTETDAKKFCPLHLQYCLPENVICQHYDIKLMTPFVLTSNAENYYWGNVTYNLQINNFTKNISFHSSSQLEIDENSSILRSSNGYVIYYPVEYTYCSLTQIATFHFGSNIYDGSYTFSLQFNGTFTSNSTPGFFKVIYRENRDNERALLATNFVWDARRVFPCWDEPRLKATFSISVSHAPQYTVWSNTRIKNQTMENDFMWTHFNVTPRMSTYLVGIAIFDSLAIITNSDETFAISGRPIIVKELQSARDVITLCTDYILKAIDIPDDLGKMDHVAIPRYFLSKSNWGLYTYRESEIGYDKDATFADKQNFSAPYIAQALAYHLFGSVVSPMWWNYTWLSEGITKFLGLHITDKVFGQFRVMDRFVVEEQQLLLSEDISSRVKPVMREIETPEEIDALFSDINLKKAIALIRMMYHFISGDKIFLKGIYIYSLMNFESSTTPDDLWKSFEKYLSLYSPSKSLYYEWNLKTVMTNWLSRSDYPVLYVERLPLVKRVKITQYCLNKTTIYNCNLNLWWLPVTFTTESDINFDITWSDIWVTADHMDKYIEDVPDGWIIVNLQQVGYYRVNYEKENWQKLIQYLQFDDHTKIHPVNRAQLIDDSYYLMLAGHLESSVFLGILKYLKKERDYIAWYPMKRILSNMSTFLRYSESVPFKKYIKEIFIEIFKEVVFVKPKPDTYFGQLLRSLVLELACMLDISDCSKEASKELSKYFYFFGPDDPEDVILPPSWKNWLFCTGMRNANESTWTAMSNKYIFTKKIEYLEYSSCTESSDIIIQFIGYLGLNYYNAKDHERWKIIRNILEKHISKDEVLRYVLTNYSWITFKYHLPFPLIYIIITNVYSTQHFEQIKEFIREHSFTQAEIEEIHTHENVKRYLFSIINARSKKLSEEVKMFTKLLT